jgi:hypothetical protein
MAPVKHLVIDQGTTFSFSITVTDIQGNPINLTGYTLTSQLRKSYNSNTYTAFVVTAPTPLTGEMTLSLTATTTSSLKYGRYVYDVEIRSASNEVTRVLEGIITVNPEVTK